MPALGDVVALLERWYPPDRAEDWDAVGLVCGDPEGEVRRILLAVDPVLAVADEAVATGAQLVVTHHPLFLKGVHGVAATTPKGRVVHRLVTNGCGLLAMHTNADAPAGGVSESLAFALGLRDVIPLLADPVEEHDKLVVFVPVAHAERVRGAGGGGGRGGGAAGGGGGGDTAPPSALPTGGGGGFVSGRWRARTPRSGR